MLEGLDNRVGRRVRHWLARYRLPRVMADFERRLSALGPGAICLDLGANVGTVTRQLAATGATVHAFEPDPLAWAELCRNVGALPNVVLHNCAVAATSGRLRLYRSTRFAENPLRLTVCSSIIPKRPELFQDDDGIEVEVRAFPDVLAGFGTPVALVKMDIEGSEFAILRQIVADPAAFDVDAIFCETHERDDMKKLFPEVEALRLKCAALARPEINLYWP